MAGARSGARGHETASWRSRPATCETGSTRCAVSPSASLRLEQRPESASILRPRVPSLSARHNAPQLRAGERGRRDAARGLLPAREPGVAPAPRRTASVTTSRRTIRRPRRYRLASAIAVYWVSLGVIVALEFLQDRISPATEIRVALHDRNGLTLDWPSSPDSPFSGPLRANDLRHGRKPRMLASSPQFLADGIGTDMVVPHSVCNPRADCFGPSRTTCREPHSLRPSPWRPYSSAWRSGRTWTWRLR